MDSAAGHHADVKVREADGDEARPGQGHVAIVQKADAAPSGEAGLAKRGAGEAIEFSASEMAERVARKRIQREHDDVDGHHQGADADAEMTVEIVGEHDVIPEKTKEHEREIEKVAVNVLQDERKRGLTFVLAV